MYENCWEQSTNILIYNEAKIKIQQIIIILNNFKDIKDCIKELKTDTIYMT